MKKENINLQYKADVSKYQKKDAIIAICLWVILMLLYAVAGMFGGLYATITNIILPIACIAIVLIRRQGISSLGFRKKNFWPSFGVGLLCGIIAIIFNNGVLPAVIYGWKFEPFGFLLYRFLYQLVAIALFEEIIFRGYIQTRLYGIFKKDVSVVLMGGLLFVLMHIPFQIASGNMIFGLSLVIWLATTFIWHIVFNVLFRKFYSIYGVILFHALMNWSGDIFYRESSPFWSNYIFLGIAIFSLGILGIRALYLRERT